MKSFFPERLPSVQRVNLSWYSQLWPTLNPLKGYGSVGKFEGNIWFELYMAKSTLETLVDQSASTLQLRVSRGPINSLIHLLDRILAGPTPESEREFAAHKHEVAFHASRLEPLLQGELSIQNAYLIRPKRAYDIDLLIEDAARIFSDEVRRSLAPIERYDIAQAGKCLAFEVPTAALFHIFRAADSVLRRYYKSVTGTEPKPKMRNWGTYIKNLRKAAADERIVCALEQMKDLHRNPVIHPEAESTIEEALSYVGIAESVISAMVMEINLRPLAPLIVSPASLPPHPAVPLLEGDE